jgi:hypothetical protein
MLRSRTATRGVACSVHFEPVVLEVCELPPKENVGFDSRRIAIEVQAYPTGLLVRGFGKVPATA